jgi:hypothetical protein
MFKSSKKDKPNANEQATQPQANEDSFDLRQALNNSEFVEFLGKDQKAAEKLDDGSVQKKWEVFQAKKEVAPGLTEILSEEIAKKAGVELQKEDRAAVAEYINKLAIDKPEEILKLRKQMEQFDTLPLEIDEQEAKKNRLMSELGIDAGGVRKEKARLNREKAANEKALQQREELTGLKRFKAKYFGEPNEREIAKLDLKQLRQNAEMLGARIDAAENLQAASRAHGEAMNELAGIQQAMFEKNEFVKGLKETLKNRALEQVEEMLGQATTIRGLEKVSKKVQDLTGENGILAEERSRFMSSIDKNMSTIFKDNLVDSVSRASVGGSNPLDQLEAVFQPYLNYESLGSLDSKGVVKLIRQTVKEVIGTTADNVKKILLNHILNNMLANEGE